MAKTRTDTMIEKDKIRGMFLGTAIGDALGKPSECLLPGEIKKHFGWIKTYRNPRKGSRNTDPAGTWTDDTQLSLAVAEGLLDHGGFNMRSIADRHIEALEDTTAGWGGTTRDAVKNLKDGVAWSKSGITAGDGRGVGNGIAMKISPLAAYGFLRSHMRMHNIVAFSVMTHDTKLAIQSGIMQAYAIIYCLKSEPRYLKTDHFLDYIYKRLEQFDARYPDMPRKEDNTPDLKTQVALLRQWPVYSFRDVSKLFGGGSPFAYHSLPFAFYFFLKHFESFDAVEYLANAGGDTDTNAAMVGAMLGALHGVSIFPTELVKQLDRVGEIIDLANKFYYTFRNKRLV